MQLRLISNWIHQTLKILSIVTLALIGWSWAQEPPAEAAESDRLNSFFESSFQGRLDRSPSLQTTLGIKTDYGKWDDVSDAAATREMAIVADGLARLRNDFDYDRLDVRSKLSYRLFEFEAELQIAACQWRFHSYPVNQMFGAQSRIPSFLISYHRVESLDDAQAYVSRLKGVNSVMVQVIKNMEVRRRQGIIPPKFVFPLVLGDCRNILEGEPFEATGESSTLLDDIQTKLANLELVSDEDRQQVLDRARDALITSVKPAYEALIASLEDLAEDANDDDGAWKFPNGGDFYNHQLRVLTTTDLSAEEIHQIGLSEMDRIHAEMRTIMAKVEFEGTLQDFFEFMREDEQFYYPNTDQGRALYLEEATAIVDEFREDLDRMFATKPKADMIVKRVEPFREKSAGKAFYNRGTLDGSRPGIYYANLYDMREMPIYQMEALAFHEGIPGHHMQLSIAQELEKIPSFRKFGRYTAYIEGWGLYCELLPKEFGYYKDSYSDFGRLAMELWRAARLVVDTGLHHKRWTRSQAIDYLVENTPNPQGDCVKAIERYIVMPGQASAYKIGMLKILELRERAKEKLGSDFDLRKFHDLILADGPMPLGILEQQVDRWIGAQRLRW